jgi:Holliday junction resolvase
VNWEAQFCNMLKDLGYTYVRVMSQYQAQPCDVVVTGGPSGAFSPIYVECKSTKHDRIALSRNKRLREQYLAFFTLCEGRGFYAVRYGSGEIRYYYPPFPSLTLREISGDPDLEHTISAFAPRPPNNPLYVPQQVDLGKGVIGGMREPEDPSL